MAKELIFTSAPEGLVAGRTGYCTVARTNDMSGRLVRELERKSLFDFTSHADSNQQTKNASATSNAYHCLRYIEVGVESYHTLTRVVPSGRDYTGRTNYVAHHLVLEESEIESAPSPFDIFKNWKYWRNKWDERPQFIESNFNPSVFKPLSNGRVALKLWEKLTGDNGHAATLVSTRIKSPIFLIHQEKKSNEILSLFEESASLLGDARVWSYTFTTSLQQSDAVSEFQWAGIRTKESINRVKQGTVGTNMDTQSLKGEVLHEKTDDGLAELARSGKKPKTPSSNASKNGNDMLLRATPSKAEFKPRATSSQRIDSAEKSIAVFGLQNPYPALVKSARLNRLEPRKPLERTYRNPAHFNSETKKTSHASSEGNLTCPICWVNFDNNEVKYVASHQELIGDEILGPTEKTRFTPTDYNDSGQPLDSFGIVAQDLACPKCHNKLPIGFTEFPHQVISLVGAPASGKTNYLAVLTRTLKATLFENFDLSFSDQDPEYNLVLNDLAHKLFGGGGNRHACIPKTGMTGSNYQQVFREQREVELPRPFLFNISSCARESSSRSLIFYDNAGEHFLPQNSTAEDFQALHMAKASAICFLFDPVSDHRFKRKATDSDSIQWTLDYPDNQDVILAQMNVKIKRAIGSSYTKKLDVPLAVILGKCDLWKDMAVDWDKIRYPVENGCLDSAILDANSRICRNFLKEMNPAIVANAEHFSSCVRYFAISSFGHAPTRIPGEESLIGPEPERLEPFHVDVPALWVLSLSSEDLIPTNN